jgi:hypothetical protein
MHLNRKPVSRLAFFLIAFHIDDIIGLTLQRSVGAITLRCCY